MGGDGSVGPATLGGDVAAAYIYRLGWHGAEVYGDLALACASAMQLWVCTSDRQLWACSSGRHLWACTFALALRAGGLAHLHELCDV